MKISLNWIKEFTKIPEQNAGEIGKLFTIRTAEVEKVESASQEYAHMYVGKITEIKKHPDADKLSVCTVSLGTENKTVVCGGQNIAVGMKIVYAGKGARVRWHGEGDPVTLDTAKVRGIVSEGMICAGEEVGMTPDNTAGQKEVRIKDLSHLKSSEGTPLAEALGKDDIILEIDNKSITHRPDLWGHYGIAREFSAIFKTKLLPLDTEFTDFEKKTTLHVDSKDAKACSMFSGCIVKNLTVTESPDWLKNKLTSIGVRPINNIVDVTNYVMYELGQPMHAYDRTFVENDTLSVRFAKEGETIETIDHKKRNLTINDLLITNGKKILGLAGIMGGTDSEIKNSTTEIILESANFAPTIVRATSTHHGLRTDALQRFEKSLDPKLALQALLRACVLLKKVCPDAKFEQIATYDKTPVKENEITLDPTYVQKVIGTKISTKEMINSLELLGFEVKNTKLLHVKIPSWRNTKDISIPEDLIEEIARMHGYENIPLSLPSLPITPPREFPERTLKHIMRKLLAHGLNTHEVIRYSFYSADDVKKCMLDESTHLKIENFLSLDQTHMRTTLVPNMLKAVELNLKYHDCVRIFEFGRTYIEDGYMPTEDKKICFMHAQKIKKTTMLNDVFFDAKGTLETLFKKTGVKDFSLRKSNTKLPYAHPNKILSIHYRGAEIGHVFNIHPVVLKAYDINSDVSCFEFNFSALMRSGISDTKYTPLPKLPSLTFDVSMVVDEKYEADSAQEIIKKCAGNLIEKIELFDLYQGKNLGENKKAMAFKISLHSEERSMTDEDMARIQKEIFNEIIKAGGEIRGV